MAKQGVPFFSMNRGEVSHLALMRIDIDKLRLAADTQINIQPLAMGPGTLRPGLGYICEVDGSNPAKLLEFVFATDDTALIELTANKMRVLLPGGLLVTRVAVSTTVAGFASWTAVASTASVVTLGATLKIEQVTQGNTSYAYKTISVAGGDFGKEHALRIVVTKGPIYFKLGTSLGADDLITETPLDNGYHSLAFTPSSGTLYAQFSSSLYRSAIVDSIAIEAAGIMSLPTSWGTSDLENIQYDQSADVVYVACKGYTQRKIERRGINSWSIVTYKSDDGPFPLKGGDESIKMTPGAYIGDTTLTASRAVFKSSHYGALVRLFHSGQIAFQPLAAEETYSNVIRVFGVSRTSGATSTSDRTFSLFITGTWVGTLTLQRSFESEDAGFSDYATYTSNTSTTISDDLNNVIAWYRIGFKSGNYGSGTPTVSMLYPGGGGAGIARIVGYVSPTVVNIEVLKQFVGNSTSNWRFSEWNSIDGYPTAVALHEGRLWWAGQSRIWGSGSDDYESFDFEDTGDDAPIQRTIGKGPIANIRWLLSLNRLAVGTDAGVITARSSSFDEPLTPTAFGLKYSMTQGASNIRPISIDTKGVYTQRSGRRIYGMLFSSQAFDYKALDLTRLNPDIGLTGFVDSAVQRQLDTHIRLPLGNGKMANFLYDEDDELQAWWRVETDGLIENVAVLPGELEDRVFVVVKRTINGATKRYIEKFSRLDECEGGTTSKLADCHKVYSGAPTATITGLGHLEGKAVIVWGDGKEVGFNSESPSTIATYTVTGGQITIPTAVSNAVVGLPYTGKFISTKLAYAAVGGTAVAKKKRVDHLGMVLSKTHYQGVRYGQRAPDGSETLRSLPLIERGKQTAVDTIWSEYDGQEFIFPGQWDTDARVVVEMRAPRPATVLGFTIDIQTSG